MKIIIAALCLISTVAFGHDWYPSECCSGDECRPIDCSKLSEETRLNAHGFQISILVYADHGKRFYALRDRLRPSPDDRCHACFWIGTKNMRCIWRPLLTQ